MRRLPQWGGGSACCRCPTGTDGIQPWWSARFPPCWSEAWLDLVTCQKASSCRLEKEPSCISEVDPAGQHLKLPPTPPRIRCDDGDNRLIAVAFRYERYRTPIRILLSN